MFLRRNHYYKNVENVCKNPLVAILKNSCFWYNFIKEGRKHIEDETFSGRLCILTDVQHVVTRRFSSRSKNVEKQQRVHVEE